MINIDLSLVRSDISLPPIKTKLMVYLPGYFHWHTSTPVGCYIHFSHIWLHDVSGY